MNAADVERPLESPVFVLVEGPDDEAVVRACAESLGLADRVKVESAGGNKELNKRLRQLHVRDGFAGVRAVAAIHDADEDPAASLQSVATAFRSSRWFVGREPPGDGQVVAGTPAAGVLLLPGNGRPGALESVLLEALSADAALHCTEVWMNCLGASGLCDTLRGHRDKRCLGAWLLAHAERPDRSRLLRDALGRWDWQHPAFDGLRQLLTALAAAAD